MFITSARIQATVFLCLVVYDPHSDKAVIYVEARSATILTCPAQATCKDTEFLFSRKMVSIPKRTLLFKIQTLSYTREYRSRLNIYTFLEKNKTGMLQGVCSGRARLRDALGYTDQVVVCLSALL